MATHKKGRTGCNRTTSNASAHTRNSTNLGAHIKAAIVTMALCQRQSNFDPLTTI
jgi:hypothetical protein